jgi:hypothetical protein
MEGNSNSFPSAATNLVGGLFTQRDLMISVSAGAKLMGTVPHQFVYIF